MQVVNVIMTCDSADADLLRLPKREVKAGVGVIGDGWTAVVYHSGKAKVFTRSLEPPPGFYGCRVDNIVALSAMRAVPEDELVEKLQAYGKVDRGEGPGVLLYVSAGAGSHVFTTARIFARPNAERYKVVIFGKSLEEVQRVAELLKSL